MWDNLWTFYPVPLVNRSVFVQCHAALITVALQCSLKSGSLIPPAPFFFLKIALSNQILLYFHTNCTTLCPNSVKNAIGDVIDIVLSR